MSDLVPKKERHLGYWLQGITICISLLAVFASLLAGWMAYKASISAAEVSGRMTKENEIESRLYQQKYNLYKDFLGEFSSVINDSDIKNKNYYLEKGKKLEKLLIKYGPNIRTLSGDNVIKIYSCVYKNVQDLIIEETDSIGCEEEQAAMECSNPKWWNFNEKIVGGIYFLENEIRKDLGGNSLPELYIQDHGGWNPEFKCNKEDQKIYGDLYLQNN